jgi:hypothetical protein
MALLGLLAAIALAGCSRNVEAPTATPEPTTAPPAAPTATSTSEPTATPVPPIAEWVIGSEVAEWQKPALNNLILAFWNAFMSPEVRPDCEYTITLISPDYSRVQQQFLDNCQEYAEQQWYPKRPPIHEYGFAYYAFRQTQLFVVRVVSKETWIEERRYWEDNGLMGYWQASLTAYDFTIGIHEGRLAIHGVKVIVP